MTNSAPAMWRTRTWAGAVAARAPAAAFVASGLIGSDLGGNPCLDLRVAVRVGERFAPVGVDGFGTSQCQVEACEKQVDVLQQPDGGDPVPFRVQGLRPLERLIDAPQRRGPLLRKVQRRLRLSVLEDVDA